MPSPLNWRACVLAAGLCLATPQAQSQVQSQSLGATLEQAWSNLPETAAFPERLQALGAQLEAAKSWLAGSPALTLGHKTDRFDHAEGAREWELELSAPLPLPGQRERKQTLAEAERSEFERSLALTKWRYAGELREAYWRLRLAEVERRLTQRKQRELAQLSADVKRRLQAGDLANTDLNQALGVEQAARILALQADAGWQQAQREFAVLSGDSALPEGEESPHETATLEQHPALLAALAQVDSARARLDESLGDKRDNPELALALSRERDSDEAAYGNQVSLRLRLPLGSEARNRPRVSAANATLAEAEAAAQSALRRLQGARDNARIELHSSRQIAELAAERAKLARQNSRWLNQAFAQGELDLPGRLRADSEKFEGELALARARLELARAVSRLNQASGALP
ncbi:TolC family protein [Pseudomonas sp.]|uniref:TolC family protein n=1 Tax=Pseudomonas sp. TaxID=306 RepID=UPI002734E42B|nr:TolC family protein [Pseudomonas sp.]MDP3817121.1 TolC family protein [Pseudomonas sp.]